MSYMNINIQAFAPGTYTFSWSRLKKTPSQLVTELSKKNITINVDVCPPVLRRTKPIPIPIKKEEVIEVSPVNLCTNHGWSLDFFESLFKK
jgi:hypothetical protein